MNARVFWKLFATLLLLVYSVSAMLPLTTKDFADFASEHVTADKAGFDALVAQARERVKNNEENKADAPKASTVYNGLRDIVNDPKSTVDLQKQFFPDLDLVREPNREKRNTIVMRHLLRESQGKLKLGLDLQGGVAFTLEVPEKAFAGKDAAAQMEKAAKVMSDRINGLGVAEPLIRTVGRNTLEIQLPGADIANDPQAIDNLKKPAQLEFRMVHRYLLPKPGDAEGTLVALRENPSDLSSDLENYEVLVQRTTDAKTGAVNESSMYVRKTAAAAGNIIEKAAAQSYDGLTWHTSIAFNGQGSKIFEELTGKIAEGNIREKSLGHREFAYGRMAIVLDGKLVSAPGLKEDKAIAGGSASIDADSREKASELASVLNNPLEFPMELKSVQTVGPSLAVDAQTKSVTASVVGVGLVVVFMVAFYLSAGVISIIAVVANIVMILGVSAAMGATITLPGVAALVLTVGMAVDANILIFERIRDEMNAGKTLRNALEAGYSRALPTILDANITTLLTAGILIWMGTGPVRGFGVTLGIGIITTLITALITARGLQELCVNTGVFTRMFGLRFLKQEPKYQFLDYARRAFAVSWVVIIVGVVAIFVRGRDTLGKDFKGGEAISVEAVGERKINTTEIAEIGKAAGVKDVTGSYLEELGGKKTSLRIECELSHGGGDFSNAVKVLDALKAKHPGAFPAGKSADQLIKGREAIGATVSSSLQLNAVLSVVFALLGIALYVSLRFELGFGMGAMVSTFHDMLMTVGLCVLHGWIFGGGQFTASMVAAFLMAKGYSINDKVVVFDRIREELEANPTMSLRDVIHLAINRTLSRTILLSLTVVFAAAALFVFGAGDVKEYGLVFVFGVITGTFSSIFIASPVFFWWHKGERKSVEKAEAVTKHAWERGETNPVVAKN